jgi:hypothetical protein
MKTQTFKSRILRIVVIIALLVTFMLPEATFAQPPKWAPAHGYRTKTRHIYFPQHNFYYDIQTRNYLYFNNGNWLVSVAIPTPFISINLGRATQIQLDYYGAYPHYYNSTHRVKYKTVKVHKPKQTVIIVKEKHGNKHGHGNGNGKKH